MATIRKRIRKDGLTSYRVEIRLKGIPPQRATFRRLTDAKKWASSTESAIRENRYFKTIESQRHTLTDLVDRFIEEVLPTRQKALKEYKRHLSWWKDQIGPYVLADVTPALIAENRGVLLKSSNGRGGSKSYATVNRYLAALSVAFSEAVNEWGWLDDSPMRKVKKYKEPRGRVRYLSEDETINGILIEGERTKLLRECKASENANIYTIVVLALSTGMRDMEVRGLKWNQVDLKSGRIILTETKNDEIRGVPLVGHALELMKERAKLRHINNTLVFPGKKGNKPAYIQKPWRAALKASGIEDFRFHDLRHSTASYLAMNGASIAEIAEVLGHKTLQMVKRYSHLSEAHTTGVVASMNAKIFGE